MAGGGAGGSEDKLEKGNRGRGVPLMRLQKKARWRISPLIALLAGSIASPSAAQTPAGGTAGDWVNKLAGLETAPDLDIAALRQQVTDRVKSRADGVAAKTPPGPPPLLHLPPL